MRRDSAVILQGATTRSIDALEAENHRLRAMLRAAGLDPDEGAEAAAPPAASTGEQDGGFLQGDDDFARLLFDTMSEGAYVVDRSGRTVLCNDATLRLLGFDSADELVGRSIHELIHHSHPDGTHYALETCPIHRATRDGISMVVDDEVFFRRDGTPVPVEYRTEPLIRDGRLDGAVCTFVDITARLAAEHQLRESEARLALAVNAGGIGIFDYEIQTKRLRWDDRVRELFGLSPGRPITIEANLAAIHPDDGPLVQQALAAAFDPAGSGAYHAEFRVVGIEDGKLRWIEAQGRTRFEEEKPVRLLGVVRDVSATKEAERHLRLMVNELNHRVKNSLATVQAVAAQTFRHAENVGTARASFTERLVALARAHDVLTATNWDGADLRHLVELTVRSHSGPESERFTVDGEDLFLSPKVALAFSLALHELATNAVKYGALSNAIGRVAIRWRRFEAPGGSRLSFTWQESGGPVVDAPQRRGFGSKLIERGLAAELQGTVRIAYHADGVLCSIDAPFPSPAHGTRS